MPQIDIEAARQCQDALKQAGIDQPLLQTDSPVFSEPWQAQAFAMTLALHDRGLFSWNQWAQSLAQTIKTAQSQGDPDTGQTYYHHWLATLERLAIEVGALTSGQLTARQQGWRDAAARTPHGQPIELSDSEKVLPTP